MLTSADLESILTAIPRLHIAVLGDLFLSHYLDIDPALTEPSVETGLDAYQVVRVRSFPGAAGTVINNLAALGVGTICVISVIGDDGEGYELRQALARMPAVDADRLITHPDRRTPTYSKPMLGSRELNRLDIKNRAPLPASAQAEVLRSLENSWPGLDALVIVDQVSEPDCGVVTEPTRRLVSELEQRDPKVAVADSRERIGRFENVMLKPNERECLAAVEGAKDVTAAAMVLARCAGRTVFCTRGERGILVAEPHGAEPIGVPAFPVLGPIDSVGAGDSTSAAIACALAAGVSPTTAAAFGNLVASITVQQIGTTGTATPAQIRRRWQEVNV